MHNSFFKKLTRRSSGSGVFNPYKNEFILNNLKHYLEYLYDNKYNEVLLIGEALGFSGGRLTGLPFSSGELIMHSDYEIFKDLRSKMEIEVVEGERTASMIWETLSQYNTVPIFWNAFPFHPYQKRKPKSNRAPTQKELQEGRFYIEELVKIFEPKMIASIGRKGQSALQQIYPDREVTYIRHPSYGGKRDFIEGIEKLFCD